MELQLLSGIWQREFPPTEALDARGMLRDGVTMRTKTQLMDGVSLADDADRRCGLIDSYEKRLTEAWRTPPAPPPPEVRVAPPPTLPTRDMKSVYADYDSRTEGAWR